jgi:hypothetical protein
MTDAEVVASAAIAKAPAIISVFVFDPAWYCTVELLLIMLVFRVRMREQLTSDPQRIVAKKKKTTPNP